MKKKIFSILAVATAIATVAASSTMFANAADPLEGAVEYSQTRYRYNIIDLNNEAFTVGENVNSYGDVKIGKNTIKKFFGTGKPEVCGTGKEMLYNATVENCDILGVKTNLLKASSKNTATYDVANNKYPNDAVYETLKMSIGLTSSRGPLTGKPNIALGDKENGIMYYVKQDGLDGKENMMRILLDSTGTPYHIMDAYQRSLNVTIHEYMYDDQGNQIPNPSYDPSLDKDADIYATAAFNTGDKNPITFVWTADKTIEYFEYVVDASGNKVLDETTKLPLIEIKTRTVTVGEKEVVLSSSGHIEFPKQFEGYVITPFSSLVYNSDWANCDIEPTNIALKKVISTNMFTGFYYEDRGDLYVGEYSFYGSAFETVDKVVDYGVFTKPGEEGKGDIVSGDPIPDPEDPVVSDDDSDETTDGSSNKNPDTGATGVAGAVAVCALAAASIVAFKRKK
ncbi:MAG: NPXTG-anchored protein [Oscillospiraceae bacterium]